MVVKLVLFNLTKRQFVYTRLLKEGIGDFTSGNFPAINGGYFYYSIGKTMYCSKVETGELKWQREFSGNFLFSGLTIADGKIFTACENTNLYALSAETGNILWEQPIAGTTNTPFYMNGVVYIASGGDGLFYALDANSGQILWKKESPDMREDSGAFFFGYVTGEKGKVYVQSYRSAYCYQAAR